jgi:NDP-sugar pyrophosphorylase family protein
MKAAIILAGGKGTRLGDGSPPKALLDLNGKTLLDCQLEWLKGKFDVVVLALGHRSQEVVDYVKKAGHNVKVCVEDAPLGTGGAAKKAFRSCCPDAEKVYILNVDDFGLADIEGAMKMPTPCIVAKPLPFSVVVGDKLYSQNETLHHIGHTVLGKADIQNLPDVGSLEQWLTKQKVSSFVYNGTWAPVNSIDQLRAAQQVYKN